MSEAVHRATLSPASRTQIAKIGSTVLAQSERALILQEVSPRKTYPPVVYFPLEDVDQDRLLPSDHSSFCPIKGEAGYYSVKNGEEVVENAAWFYRDPLAGVAAVKGHVAFFGNKVTVEEV